MDYLSSFGLLPHRSTTVSPGDRFERLTVLAVGKPSRGYRYQAVVKCDCGSPVKKVRLDGLTSGATLSCGCVQRERSSTHGLTKHPLYHRHHLIVTRCTDPKNSSYKNYGGRGITVCERWLNVENFIHDLEPLYTPGCEIDRIDNNGNYEPGNIRFVSSKTNSNNRRTTRLITHNGKTRSVREWSEETGICYGTLWERLVIWRWSAEKALSTPPIPVKERMAKARKVRWG